MGNLVGVSRNEAQGGIGASKKRTTTQTSSINYGSMLEENDGDSLSLNTSNSEDEEFLMQTYGSQL